MYRFGYTYSNSFVFGGGSSFTNTYSLSFDGVDEELNCGAITALDSASAISISYWVYPQELTNARQWGTFQSGTNEFRAVTTDNTGKFKVDLSVGISCKTLNAELNPINNWYHIVVVYDGTQSIANDRCKIYVDGVSVSCTYTGTIPTTLDSNLSGDDFEIAAFGSNFTAYQKNDEFAIFDYALTSGNVTNLYNSGVPTDLNSTSGVTAPIHWWRMGDGSDTISVIYDVGTAASNNGTPINMESGDITTDVP